MTRKVPHLFQIALLLPFILLGFWTGCAPKTVDYFSYVSECREDVYLAQNDALFLKIYASRQESPYLLDGYASPLQDRTEFYLYGISGDKSVYITWTLQGETAQGEMAYDHVKNAFFLHIPTPSFSLSSIPVRISFGETTSDLTAVSVRKSDWLSGEGLLAKVLSIEQERLRALTQKNLFLGEIRLRLIFEDAPYYYVGITDRNGETYALLCDGISGKILAKKTT